MMFQSLAAFLCSHHRHDSDIECDSSDTNSDEDNNIGNIAENQRSPPNITWKYEWSTNETQLSLSNSSFANLPTEILIHIFRLLTVRDLENVSLVCRYFKIIADQDEIWRATCNPSHEIQSKSFKQIYMDWIYGKYLHSLELKNVHEKYLRTGRHNLCLVNTCYCSRSSSIRVNNSISALPISGFIEHPNTSLDVTIKLSVDIDRTAIALIALLEKTSKFVTRWWRPTIIEQMIMRYYQFMQLKASYPNQTHLLRPDMYRNDCLRLFRRIIDHSLLINSDEERSKEEAFAHTCQLYEEHFGEQYCPLPTTEDEAEIQLSNQYSLLHYIVCPIPAYSYWDQTWFRFVPELSNNYENPFSFVETDVILDSYWFKLYCTEIYEVGMKIMINNSQTQHSALTLAMKRLRKSYERYLYLTSKYLTKNEYNFIHPTYAIDLAWHSHMQEPLKYIDDCNRLFGVMINHIPWSSTKTTDTDQITVFHEKMIDIWNEEFERNLDTDHLE
ncbi:unnamed protein product [Adineta ricciae]|uniref:F-box domain-containing protein n=1 Tax=Adineta ricciae TaxID=249248 RepID=A0A815UVV6_ADIRI|nr:unnamed protein product [Adineta ricciae]CAF1528131.1 unnamed protein product [Adineta ricciae]